MDLPQWLLLISALSIAIISIIKTIKSSTENEKKIVLQDEKIAGLVESMRNCKKECEEKDKRLQKLETEREVGEQVKEYINQRKDSDRKYLAQKIDTAKGEITAYFDLEIRRIVKVIKPDYKEPNETIEG